MKTFEIWTGSNWSPVTLNSSGAIVYVSNGGAVGNGMRITRVSDASQPNSPPIAADVNIEVQ